MTEVSLHYTDDLITLKVDGHAGDSRVCAGCSTLCGTFATFIKNLPIESRIVFEDGHMEVTLNRKGLTIYALEIMYSLKFLIQGFRLLERQYPNNVIVLEG
jgi:uncharacterized protein YsxB (DUF464 family)